jgi:putative ATP-grasp target RiPP
VPHSTPLWRDPLFSPGDRFPLGPPRGYWDDCDDEPSGPTTRPFSLRGVVAGPRLGTPPDWHYSYCPERQVAFIRDKDGSLVPLAKHTKPGPTPATSSATPDGDPRNPPPEEMTAADYQAD